MVFRCGHNFHKKCMVALESIRDEARRREKLYQDATEQYE